MLNKRGKEKQDSKRSVALSLICIFASMLLLSFAAVPIYNIFCKLTGFGGTTKDAIALEADRIGTRKLTIEFDSNIERKLPWRFIPKQPSTDVITGQNNLVFYEVENFSDQDIDGMAVYNVTPNKVGKYFVKVHCFCFETQTIKKNTKALMPVTFFIDPDFDDDPEMQDVTSITLSYSFFKI